MCQRIAKYWSYEEKQRGGSRFFYDHIVMLCEDCYKNHTSENYKKIIKPVIKDWHKNQTCRCVKC